MKSYILCCFSSLLLLTILSCQKNVQESVIEVVSGNVAYTNFIPSGADNYFVLDQNKIRFLNTSFPNSLNITSTFPFTETSFEVVRGNSDTLYIQQADGLHLYLLTTDGSVRWEEQAVISGVLPCDKFNVRYPYLLVSVGNTSCNFSSSPTELRLYDIGDLTAPKLKLSSGTLSVLRIEPAFKSAGFYVASVDGQLNNITIAADSTVSTQNILNEVSLTDFSVFGNKLLTKSRTNISQYELTDVTNAQLLSKIPVSQ